MIRRAITTLALMIGGLAPTAATADSPSAAREWIASAKAQGGKWVDSGTFTLPSGQIFIGDPTWASDYHIRDPRPAPAPALRLWTLHPADNGYPLAVFLENTGLAPVAQSDSISFGVDAAVIGLGDLNAGRALVSWGETLMDQGTGDSLEFLQPALNAPGSAPQKVPVPPDDQPIFLVPTGRDGGLKAVWLMDRNGAVSGILIDITGRAKDGLFVDRLLPAQN
jgi:hypothetical protein